MNNYSEIKFINIIKEIDFPDYDNFDNINKAYSNKGEIAIDKIAPFKQICIKSRTPEWVDLEIINVCKS